MKECHIAVLFTFDWHNAAVQVCLDKSRKLQRNVFLQSISERDLTRNERSRWNFQIIGDVRREIK